MACYYLVISSTHLSNGHFRSIKGVFRGPLRKTGTALTGYAEKGKSIANALEDLKANFYCELCDKQYHKHQEFDNHINSYDHAHKQRLKELKQREFARNVASKSWKDEKKQEKALKRLHQLAELRKQPDCVSDEGPIFKTPRLRGPEEALFLSKDGNKASAHSAIVCKGEPVTSSTIAENKEDILFGKDVMNNGKCCVVGNQTELTISNRNNVNNRAGISFCFSKKASLKLDSSASVFNESTEEVNDCSHFLNHKAKQMSVHFRHYAQGGENARENSTLTVQHETDTSMQGNIPANEELLKDDNSSRNVIKEQNEIAQSNLKAKIQSSHESYKEPLDQTEEINVYLRPEDKVDTSEAINCQTKSCCLQENYSNKHTVADAILIDHLSDFLSQNHGEHELNCNSNVEHIDACSDSTQRHNECPETSISEPLNNNSQNSLSYLSVLSKDGSTNLQWPRELLLFTKTEPSISYACNPLYFDFKCSRKNTVKKENEGVTTNCEENDVSETVNEKNSSGITTNTHLENEKNSQSPEPKREKLLLKEIHGKDYESYCNYRITKETTQTGNLSNLHENEAHVSTNLSVSQNSVAEEHHYSRKRKRSTHGLSENSIESLYSKANKNSSNYKGDSTNLNISPNDHLNIKGKNQRFEKCNSNQNQSEQNNDLSQNENDFTWDNASSSSKVSGSESDTSSERHWRSSSSQMSPTNKGIHSDSSISSSTGCKHTSTINHKSCDKISMRKENCLEGKHNHNGYFDNDNEYYGKTVVPTRDQKYKCRSLKHKSFRKTSRHERPEHQICSNHTRKEQKCRKKCKSPETDHNGENLATLSPKPNNCRTLSEKGTYSRSSQGRYNGESFSRTETKETSYECYSQNIVSLSGNCKSDCTSEKNVIVKEKKTLIAELLVDKGHPTKKVEKEFTSGNYSESCGIKLKKQSHTYFAVKFPPSAHETEVVPFLKNVNSSNNSTEMCGTNDTIENGADSSKTEGSQGYEVTVTTNGDKCLFKDIIHIGTECRTLNNEIQVSVAEQSKQLFGEVQHFMQNSDQVHFNFKHVLPSLKHLCGTESPETKEEQKGQGQHETDMKSSPIEGNVKCCYDYDSAMQNFCKTDNNQRIHHKSTTPPTLSQQPITYSPDEVDKYRLLQLQAQQHIQKQLITKHFKALPTTGSAVYTAAQTIQPVSVQQHPSITTIHHALMQRYAVTASMHSSPNHFAVSHLNHFPQSHFSPIALPSLTPAIFPTHPTFLAGHPLHLVSASAIHPAQLTIQAIPHTALIPTLFTPHPNTGMHPAIHFHPLIHPLFQGHDFHHNSGTNQIH
ncbi:zinc finger protein 804B [Rhinophrynus dorsalis]